MGMPPIAELLESLCIFFVGKANVGFGDDFESDLLNGERQNNQNTNVLLVTHVDWWRMAVPVCQFDLGKRSFAEDLLDGEELLAFVRRGLCTCQHRSNTRPHAEQS
jgi:hypothetical protein